MPDVVIYSSNSCSYCDRAKKLLEKKGVTYQEIRVDSDEAKRAEMITRSGRRTVPQIFINGKAIGGFDDLWSLEQQGKLDQLLTD